MAFSGEIGDQIRRKRLSMGLFQKDVARMIGVSEDCITYWENKRSLPLIHHFPAIIKFLGFNPFKKDGDTLSIRIQNYRIEHGLSHKKMGRRLRVDGSTVASWEKDTFSPNKSIQKLLLKILSTA
ncbi:MAG: helix-turn-helix domain-containing protein [Chitinophagales bacterium]|nr:helix-turn-helix domain-containing protein [Chitinophagales bacterium]